MSFFKPNKDRDRAKKGRDKNADESKDESDEEVKDEKNDVFFMRFFHGHHAGSDTYEFDLMSQKREYLARPTMTNRWEDWKLK